MKKQFATIILILFALVSLGPLPSVNAHAIAKVQKGWLCGLKLCLCDSHASHAGHSHHESKKKESLTPKQIADPSSAQPFYSQKPCHSSKNSIKQFPSLAKYNLCDKNNVFKPSKAITKTFDFLHPLSSISNSLEKPPQNALLFLV